MAGEFGQMEMPTPCFGCGEIFELNDLYASNQRADAGGQEVVCSDCKARDDLAQRLVRAVHDDWVARENRAHKATNDADAMLDWSDFERGAVVAVLRELPVHPESGRREHGRYWTPEALRDLADDIEGTHRA